MVGNTSFGFGIRAENLREARYILFLKCSKEEVVLSISSRADHLREVGYMQNPVIIVHGKWLKLSTLYCHSKQ